MKDQSKTKKQLIGELQNFRQVEEELKQNQANLTALIENTTDDIWSVDSDYHLTTMNSNFQRNFKTAFSISLEVGDNIVEILDDISLKLKKRWKERYDRALQGERFTIVDHYDLENVPQYIEAAFNPIRINSDIVGVSVFSHDITEQTRIQKELEKKEERYRLIAENTGDVIWIYELQIEKYTYVSPSVQRLRGYSPEEVMTQSMEEAISPESYRKRSYDLPMRIKAYQSGDASELIQTDEVEIIHKDGNLINAEVVTTLLIDKNGEVYAILGVTRDITKRKQAEKKLRKINNDLQTHVLRIEALQVMLREQATRDSLTTLYNRHYLQETLEREIKRAFRRDRLIGILMIDIDHFKHINDTYGHKTGDLVLKELGKLMKSHVRVEDVPCRYGGDEMLVIMPEATLEIVRDRAELIRKKFESMSFPYDGQNLHATLSIGVAVYQVTEKSDKEDLLNYADKALYMAKEEGRNRVVTYTDSSQAPLF